MRHLLDLTGQRFGKLTVIKFSHSASNERFWLCKCDCGNTWTTQTGRLTKGFNKSCGCGCNNKSLRGIPKPKKRVSDLQKLTTHAFGTVRRNAKSRGLSFNLSRSQVSRIMREPCFYCGIIGGNKYTVVGRTEGGTMCYNGIDRVDNSIGYEIENVVACCATCNSAKREMSKTDFIGWVSRVAKHSLSHPKAKKTPSAPIHPTFYQEPAFA